MTLYEKIEQDIKTAMKEKDVLRRGVLVLLKSAIINKAIEKQVEKNTITDEEIESIVVIEVKRRRDVATQYRAVGRDDKAKQEEDEVIILLTYLPPQFTEKEIEILAEEIIESIEVRDMKVFGKVMSLISTKTKGRADGSLVAKIVKEKLLR